MKLNVTEAEVDMMVKYYLDKIHALEDYVKYMDHVHDMTEHIPHSDDWISKCYRIIDFYEDRLDYWLTVEVTELDFEA